MSVVNKETYMNKLAKLVKHVLDPMDLMGDMDKIENDIKSVSNKIGEQIDKYEKMDKYLFPHEDNGNNRMRVISLCDLTEECLWSKCTNGVYRYVNKNMADNFLLIKNPIGYTMERVKDIHVKHFGKDGSTLLFQCMEANDITLKEGKKKQWFLVGTLHGKPKSIKIVMDIVKDENDNVIGTVGSCKDITKTKEIIDSLVDEIDNVAEKEALQTVLNEIIETPLK